MSGRVWLALGLGLGLPAHGSPTATASPAASPEEHDDATDRWSGSAWAWGAQGAQAVPDLAGGGLGGAVGLRLAGPLHLDLAAEAGLDARANPWLGARPELRLLLPPRLAQGARLGLLGGGGLRWSGALRPDLSVGAALDLPGWGRVLPRIQARYLLDPRGGGATLQAGVGLAWPRPAPHDAPVVPPPAAPPPAAPDARPRDWSWVPHPVSACVETDLLGAASAAAGDPSSAAHVGLPGLALPSGLDLRALLHPTQGSLVVVAQPGDEVVVSGRQVPLGADATAVSNAPEGPIEVQIRGAGQLQVLMPAIASGYAVWVRSRPDPSPAVISFAQGSSTLAPQDLERLAALAQNAGGWRFELRGSSSPEGDAASNRALAQARAQAVKDALLAAGLPAARVQVAPEPEQAAAGLPAAEQRVCKILPLPPEPP